MPIAACSDTDFVSLLERVGVAETARRLKLDERNVYKRRALLETKLGRQITVPETPGSTRHGIEHPGRLTQTLSDGIVLVGSDAHYWPGIATTAHRALVKFCKTMKPVVVVCNGDIFDGASVSRHAPIMWEEKPTVIQELEACQERLGEIETAAFKARKIWTLGNHDARFETRLATQAPEYANVHGLHLKDHFGAYWEPCWSLFINDDVVIKHRFRGGIHATHNNVMWTGKTTVTGHLHSLKVTPFTDYGGTRWGVDTGTLADPFGPQFEYLEDGPRNWRGGFIVLTFHKGRLLWPEPVHVIGEGQVEFRGEVIDV